MIRVYEGWAFEKWCGELDQEAGGTVRGMAGRMNPISGTGNSVGGISHVSVGRAWAAVVYVGGCVAGTHNMGGAGPVQSERAVLVRP